MQLAYTDENKDSDVLWFHFMFYNFDPFCREIPKVLPRSVLRLTSTSILVVPGWKLGRGIGYLEVLLRFPRQIIG